MTKKLRKKCKKIAITIITGTLSLATIGVASAKLLVMSEETSKRAIEPISIAKISTAYGIANIKESIYGITNSKEESTIKTNTETKSNTETEPLNSTALNTTTQMNKQEKSKEPIYADDGAIICESIVQGTKEYNIPNGNHIFRVEGKNGEETETKDYPVEFINYGLNEDKSITDITYAENTSLGDTSTDKKMLIVKYHGNLTINEGVTVTATNVGNYTYKKGMYICVLGDLINNGNITMTARGTYQQEGENVYLWKNADNTYEYIPANGGAGAPARNVSVLSSSGSYAGVKGTNGTERRTGGGGSGGLYGYRVRYYNAGGGANGTSYSGGAGGGGLYRWSNSNATFSDTSTFVTTNAKANGGAGGTGHAYQTDHTNAYANGGGGGAGNPGGTSGRTGTRGTITKNIPAQIGTGGLLILYSDTLYNYGTISSNGSNGGTIQGNGGVGTGGAGSGAGSINIFAGTLGTKGTLTANGGASGLGNSVNGGEGGNGSIIINEVASFLNYPEKEITLDIEENYKINKESLTIGEITYSIIDTEIATINEEGSITPHKTGKTKIKITDETNEISTYIYLNIVNNIKPDIKMGMNYTIALKQNGTIWSYGTNANGELGTGENEQKEKQTQIKELQNIEKISTGYSHSLALTKTGEVYAWGLGTKGQLGNGKNENSNKPIKIDSLSNIKEISAYKNISVAITQEGEIYTWGEGNANTPTKKTIPEKAIQVSGTLILTENGNIYNITEEIAKIEGISDIAKISCGESHNLALTTKGIVYTWGINTYGECGLAQTGNIEKRAIKANIIEISAGNQISLLLDEQGKIFTSGNNNNGQIGMNQTAKITTLTEIQMQDIKIENISCRKLHT